MKNIRNLVKFSLVRTISTSGAVLPYLDGVPDYGILTRDFNIFGIFFDFCKCH